MSENSTEGSVRLTGRVADLAWCHVSFCFYFLNCLHVSILSKITHFTDGNKCSKVNKTEEFFKVGQNSSEFRSKQGHLLSKT